jgi:hypothetical protein
MSPLACLRAMQLAAASGSGLDEADRLRLDEHLGRCLRCSAEASLLAGIVRAAKSAGSLDEKARADALAGAFRVRQARPVEAPTHRWSRAPVLVAAAVALAASALLAIVRDDARSLARSFQPSALAASMETIPTEETFAVRAGETRAVEGARVSGLREATMSWLDEEGTLRVTAGELHVEVDPGRRRPFVVVMPRYEVEVLGTVFDVEDGAVTVEHGRVRVSWVDPLAGEAEQAIVSAGERWELPIRPSATEATSAPALPASRVPVAALLAQARSQLAAVKPDAARRIVERALASRPTPREHAEAQSLLAECALVAGNPEEAARRYAEVAKKHGDLPAGETALFAAGRAAQRAGRTEEAKKLFTQYLTKHPNGQFAKDAKARLAQLGS